MVEKEAVVGHEEGLHARPAKDLVKKAGQFESRIQIGKAGKVVKARIGEGYRRMPGDEEAFVAIAWPGRAPPERLELPKKARMV